MLELSKISREDWFRIEEREKTSVPCPQVGEGDYIRFQRIIIRAGYFWEPRDMPESEAIEAAYQMVMEEANARKVQILFPSDWTDIRPTSERIVAPEGFSREHIKFMIATLGTTERAFFKHLIYKARGRWMNGKKTDRIRTFYYADLPQAEYFQVERRVFRMIGKQWPGFNGYMDPEPPSFEPWTRQGVYSLYNPSHLDEQRVFYIHPLDIIPGEKI